MPHRRPISSSRIVVDALSGRGLFFVIVVEFLKCSFLLARPKCWVNYPKAITYMQQNGNHLNIFEGIPRAHDTKSK